VASNGPAAGLLSVDIGVSETGVETTGNSLQLTGSGQFYEDFSWAPVQPNTSGAINTGQVFSEVTAAAVLVINEIDYDQANTDSAEFVEIRNTGTADAALDEYTLELIDGAGGGAVANAQIALPSATLAPGAYFVVCGDAAKVPNCDFDTAPDADLLENGAPDAVGLRRNGELVDAVSYEGDTGAPYTEDSGVGLADPGEGSIGRCPDGNDTDVNASDFRHAASVSPGAANACSPAAGACGDPATLIHAIQGAGPASALLGAAVSIEGVVVGDFQDGAVGLDGDLDGFYVQEEDADADADPDTSNGVFVFDGPASSVDVHVGDEVRVSGTVAESSGRTEVAALTSVQACATAQPLPALPEVSLPVSAVSDFEKYEGMRIQFPALVIAEYANFDRYGEIVLTAGRLYQATAVFDPGTPEAAALAALNTRSRIILDDARTVQNPDPARHPNGNAFDLNNLFRGGDTLEQVTGVMDYRSDSWRIQPTQGATHSVANPRTSQAEDVSGTLRVASFNVLNYFNGDGLGGGFPTSRGADTLAEFTRQRDKIIAALVAMDADIIGVVEIENDGYEVTSAIQDLVNGLNDATAPGTYAFIDPGVPAIGADEIAVGLLYQPSAVVPQGSSAILDSSVDPDFIDTRNRPSLAQSFSEVSSGEVLTVAINHFKSKGSACADLGDPDTGDGSGNCNLTRTKAAQALVEWLATDPTVSGDADVLVLGDLNAYNQEDPIDVFISAGYAELLGSLQGPFAYSYLFDAQLGYLDYALSSPSLTGQISGVTAWHINADEPDLIDYDTAFKLPNQIAIYAPDAYRSSDHDPVLVGLSLQATPPPEVIHSDGFEAE
jgi:predicted extracellular nuclease